MNKELIDQIVAREWKMFDAVQNEGGRASCQNDPYTFRIMRSSQFSTWPEGLLRRYLKELEMAGETGRNLLMEKYAFMMESTAPEQFEGMRHLLPSHSAEVMAKIREIVGIHVEWERRTDEAYPHVRRRGRPLTSDQDGPHVTSFETYLRGELQTWSDELLELYLAFTRECLRTGRNLADETGDCMVRSYGYASMQDAEEKRSH